MAMAFVSARKAETQHTSRRILIATFNVKMALSQERTFLVQGESDELTRLLRDIIDSPDPAVWKSASKRITAIFDTYLEQPYLLDPHLGGLIAPIMHHVRKTLRVWHATRIEEREAAAALGLGSAFAFQILNDPHLNALLAVVYHACKTRGFKHIVKLMPHEVADLEPAVQALCCQDLSDHLSWETRYVLLLWLSILALVPFDLDSIDSGGGGSGGLISSLVSTCKSFLSDPGPVGLLRPQRQRAPFYEVSAPFPFRFVRPLPCAWPACFRGQIWSAAVGSSVNSWNGLQRRSRHALLEVQRQACRGRTWAC